MSGGMQMGCSSGHAVHHAVDIMVLALADLQPHDPGPLKRAMLRVLLLRLEPQ